MAVHYTISQLFFRFIHFIIKCEKYLKYINYIKKQKCSILLTHVETEIMKYWSLLEET